MRSFASSDVACSLYNEVTVRLSLVEAPWQRAAPLEVKVQPCHLPFWKLPKRNRPLASLACPFLDLFVQKEPADPHIHITAPCTSLHSSRHNLSHDNNMGGAFNTVVVATI